MIYAKFLFGCSSNSRRIWLLLVVFLSCRLFLYSLIQIFEKIAISGLNTRG